MTFITIPNRPLGTDVRSIEAILADFDAITTVVNGQLDTTNLASNAGITYGQINPGSWVAISPGSNWVVPANYDSPAIRVQGTTVQVKGALQNNTGGSFAGSFALVPNAGIPSKNRQHTGTGFPLLLDTTGHISAFSTPIPNGQIVSFDGWQYIL